MTTKKMALLRLSPEAMCDLFQLPEGVEIVRVEHRPGYRGVLDSSLKAQAGTQTKAARSIQPSTPS